MQLNRDQRPAGQSFEIGERLRPTHSLFRGTIHRERHSSPAAARQRDGRLRKWRQLRAG
jgi:hypothetical protein